MPECMITGGYKIEIITEYFDYFHTKIVNAKIAKQRAWQKNGGRVPVF